jgi:hypothetical protein
VAEQLPLDRNRQRTRNDCQTEEVAERCPGWGKRTVYGTVFNAMAALKALTYFEDGNLKALPSEVKYS